MAEMNTPDWLKPSDNDLAVASSGGSTVDLENGSSTPMSQDTATTSDKADNGEKKRFSFSCSCGAVTVLLISTAFFGLFVYSAIVQNNDTNDRLQWLIFYSLSASLVGLFMVSYMGCCFPSKAFYVLSTGMSIWAIVILILSALAFKDTVKGAALRQELGYEMGGASISLLSSLYHTTMICCCVANKDKKGEE